MLLTVQQALERKRLKREINKLRDQIEGQEKGDIIIEATNRKLASLSCHRFPLLIRTTAHLKISYTAWHYVQVIAISLAGIGSPGKIHKPELPACETIRNKKEQLQC
ncbi:MAG TPA: hypothetical protein ENI15_13290 [Spirochaetes bacterium]|nr:hypothetical protein [Spirochaetota bacterium]